MNREQINHAQSLLVDLDRAESILTHLRAGGAVELSIGGHAIYGLTEMFRAQMLEIVERQRDHIIAALQVVGWTEQ